LFGHASAALSPVFQPLGIGNWETAGALMSGFVAKEIVISTMSQIYIGPDATPADVSSNVGQDLVEVVRGFGAATLEAGKALINIVPGVGSAEREARIEDTALSAALRAHYTPLTAVAMVAFVLLYVPCAATLGAIRHEYGGRWAVFSAGYQLTLAWGTAFVIYQGGRLLGLG
jgi:ferrous iron transport protein B